ncbi:MAG TPA: recombinase, partial [Limnobacter sp.]|nr:recombinase [Limnobacter sp.]
PDRLRKVVWLRKRLGVVRLNKLADYLANNTGALAGNFFFGCMLGSAGFVGLMLGLPIDIRHITFAAANLAYATHTFEFQLAWEVFAISMIGVLAIGMTNLAVSFSLAFFTALKARGVRPLGSTTIGRRLLKRFVETPGQFFYPPKSPEQGSTQGFERP